MATESIRTSEDLPSLENRISDYFPRPEILEQYPSPRILDLEAKERCERLFPNSEFALVRDHTTGKFVLAPMWHPLQTSSPHNPGFHYAHVAFEGGSLLPKVDDNGELVRANILLHPERMQRMKKSITSLGLLELTSERDLANFNQAIFDLATISRKALTHMNGGFTRAYLRAWAARDDTGIGVAPKEKDFLAMGAYFSTLSTYLKPEAYENGAISIAFLGSRRESKILGKNAMNYGAVAGIAKKAKELGGHEASLFAPYWIDPDGGSIRHFDLDENIAVQEALKGGLIADGPGEDIIFFTKDGELLYQLMNTNILAGTTREYAINHLAPFLGIPTREQAVSVDDIRKGRIVGAAFTGNAVGILGIRRFDLIGLNGELLDGLKLEIVKPIETLTKRFELERTGWVQTAGPLLTPVDLNAGDKALEILKEVYPGWF